VSDFDASWASAVRAVCDPVFDAADAAFVAQVMMRDDVTDALLWEALPERFAARYPDSWAVESYGTGWPPPCLDFWVYVRADTRRAELRPDGVGEDVVVALSGDGVTDGLTIAREFARMLGVPSPAG